MERSGLDVRDLAAALGLSMLAATIAFAEGGVSRLASNEVAAIATLRNLASAQAQIQTSGKIDADADGIGEHGTFLELTGTVGVRSGMVAARVASESGPMRTRGVSFRKRGSLVVPAILSPALSNVNEHGSVLKAGYAFRILLPDTAEPAGFVHEKGPHAEVSLAGGTGAVGVDLSETTWCAYAQPETLGETGQRRFFINQAADVLQSANTAAKAAGGKDLDPRSAFRGDGITSRVAVGSTGRDGDVWKVTN